MVRRTGKINLVKIFISIGKPFYYLLLLIIHLLRFLSSLLVKIINIKFSFPKIILPKINLQFYFPKKKKRHKKIILYSRKKNPQISYKLCFFLLGVILSLASTFYFLSSVFHDLPSPQKLSKLDQILTTKIYDKNNNLLYKIYRQKDRTLISLNDLPLFVTQAIISIEDKEFYSHKGISLSGITRAIYLNLFMGKNTGGSTITQQLIKNTLLTSEKTWKRKIKEATLALLVEKKYSKNQILEMYLNEVGFGGETYGIEEASEKYFNIPAKNLKLAQAALLAGLPASPTRYSPFGSNSNLAKERQILVLQKMFENNFITKDEMIKAQNEKLIFAKPGVEITAPHFVMYVKNLLVEKYGEALVEEGGLEVKTSLDLNIQDKAREIVAQEIAKLHDLHITNGAALVTNPKTGEILAMIGSKDYFASDIDGNYNVTTALRQPGSSIKPINYAIALENGFNPATMIEDSPIIYSVPGQEPYSPKNYDNRYHGRVTIRTALASSYNVPAVKILAAFGVNKMIQKGRDMGITSWNDPSRYGLSLTLGGGEVKMVDMAVVYGTIANNGIRVDLNPILEVKDYKGKILEKNNNGTETAVLNPAVAYLLTNILSDNIARAPAFGFNSVLNSPRPMAVKTGTTQNLRDNWTIGYSPSLLTAVWVGNNDNSPMSYVASGITGASPIWRKIMDEVLKDKPFEAFNKPGEIKEVAICSTTGTLPCDGCPNVKIEVFLSGTEPKFTCSPEKVKEVLERKSQPTYSPQIL